MKHDLDKLIKLSNINIENHEAEDFKESVDSILTWCDELDKVDTTGIMPMFSIYDINNQGLENLREDKVTEGNCQSEILSNAPDKEDVFICVPKVID